MKPQYMPVAYNIVYYLCLFVEILFWWDQYHLFRKYYFDVKRLEDGFDLSGVNSPQLDHPPLKSVSIAYKFVLQSK